MCWRKQLKGCGSEGKGLDSAAPNAGAQAMKDEVHDDAAATTAATSLRSLSRSTMSSIVRAFVS